MSFFYETCSACGAEFQENAPHVCEDLMGTRWCGGCEGQGAHWRWCPVKVGEVASRYGQMAEQAESLGDRVGPNEKAAANHLWAAASLLRGLAEQCRVKFEYEKGKGPQ